VKKVMVPGVGKFRDYPWEDSLGLTLILPESIESTCQSLERAVSGL